MTAPAPTPTDATGSPVAAGEPVIRLSGLTKRFGTGVDSLLALDDVSFEVRPGEVVALLGLSGSGKSTLLSLLDGLQPPTSGDGTVLGTALARAGRSELRALRRRIGFVFQQFHLVGRLSVLENVCTGALGSLRGPRLGLLSYPRAVRERALDGLEQVGLAAHAFQRADTLSGGQQQRVAVARALMQEPALLLADEPVASLDPESSAQVMRLLARVAKERELTVLCSLHQVDLALSWAHRIVGLRSGRVVMDVATEGIDRATVMRLYEAVAAEGAESVAAAVAAGPPAVRHPASAADRARTSVSVRAPGGVPVTASPVHTLGD
ncbi:phosphonate ABC transporter ATP-binding protein [Streptomyces malaysiensis]|uniref:phosphonate ABC transporter ATP-binding protein n=1 Tax=Streptomyces malaysiensis TaxID=92644 RepID=UPI002B30DC42|nr:phosphonate ABC transporter ATP-binding protein [Streptomyces malaysiensis]